MKYVKVNIAFLAIIIFTINSQAQNSISKQKKDSLLQLYHENIDTIFVKNLIYLSGDSVNEISSFRETGGDIYFSKKAYDFKYCDTTSYRGVRFIETNKRKEFKKFYFTERYSFIEQKDTLVGQFDRIKTTDWYSQLGLIEASYNLNVDDKLDSINFENYIKIYFYSRKNNELFSFLLNLENLKTLYYQKIVLKDFKPVITKFDSVDIHRVTKRHINKFKEKVSFPELKALSVDYMNKFKMNKLEHNFIIVDICKEGKSCSYIFGEYYYTKLYKKRFKETLFYDFLADLYYPIISKPEHGYNL